MKRAIAGLALLALVLLTPTHGSAQVSGVAFAAFAESFGPFSGFVGPWRLTATGLDIKYIAVCYSLTERRKVVAEAVAAIPDGSTLAQLRTLSTTAVVEACADQGITVPRGAVLLPAVQLGQ
jgi:hypothetical protein